MIELFNAATSAQTEKHYTTIRTLIPVVNPTADADIDFCTCTKQCVPPLLLFTDEVGTDEFKNDWFTMYQNTVSGGSHTLAIIVNGSEIAITDDTYGKEYDGTYFYGYRFDAYDIWNEHGYGNYQFVMRAYDSGANLLKETYSATFKLMRYRDVSANGTVVIESRKNGKLRHGLDYSNLEVPGGVTRGLPYWPQRVRLPGKLKWAGAPVELSGVVMNDLVHSREQVFDTMNLEYDIEIYLVSSSQILDVIFDDLFANEVYVTDYNVYNFEKYRKLKLLRNSVELQPTSRIRKSFVFKMINQDKKYEKYND